MLDHTTAFDSNHFFLISQIECQGTVYYRIEPILIRPFVCKTESLIDIQS
jgi:hypothetical protein